MKKDKRRSLPAADPNLPRWVCQNCRHSLCVIGVDSYSDTLFNDPYCSTMQGSSMHGISGSTVCMDNSFVVLPKQRPPVSQVPRGTADPGQPGKAMDKSFVVVYKSESALDGSGASSTIPEGGPNSSLPPHNSGFHSTITILKRAFEMATTQTQVDQPLCVECMRVLSDELDKEVEDVNRDIEAYRACLHDLEGEAHDVLSEADFLKEKLKMEEEERELLAAIEEIEKQNADVNVELKELESKSNQFKELDERYWQEFNNFQFQLISYQEERDAITTKIEVSQAHLKLLTRTNVLNDAFPIWHEGEFGTINNFRLGRLPKISFEWDETNAAWGQACFLLHTMCQYFRPKFQYRNKILPMGSYPRISNSNCTYELFGPVNMFWSGQYDKAMTLFLACLKDFSDFANFKDKENNIPPEKCFKLPYKIDNDEVGSYSITQSFRKQESLTKALKYTLCNLKWALFWFIGNTNFQPISAMMSLPTEAPAVRSLYSKREAGLKTT